MMPVKIFMILMLAIVAGCKSTSNDSSTTSGWWSGPKVENLGQMPLKIECMVIAPENDPSFSEAIRDPDFWLFTRVPEGYTGTKLNGSREPWGQRLNLSTTNDELVELTYKNSLLKMETDANKFELFLVSPESKWLQTKPARKAKGLRNCRILE